MAFVVGQFPGQINPPKAAGRIQIEAKADIRQRLGRSPDRADAVVMAMGYYVRPLGGCTVNF